MSKLGRAIAIAAEVHKNQTDKADAPYMLHCLAVMYGVEQHGEDAMIVAVLHDVIEDCGPADRTRICYVIRNEFGDEVYYSVKALTHEKGESYDDYIERVAERYLSRVAKISDLTHNMDPRRIPSYQIVDKDYQRWEKYRRALIRLEREA